MSTPYCCISVRDVVLSCLKYRCNVHEVTVPWVMTMSNFFALLLHVLVAMHLNVLKVAPVLPFAGEQDS